MSAKERRRAVIMANVKAEELNCQETVWKRIRYEVTTDRYATRMADLEASILATVAAWPHAKVKSFCIAKCKLY